MRHARIPRIKITGILHPADGASFLKMRGRRLYEYAVTVVPDLVHETLHRVGLRERDVDKILAGFPPDK